MELSRLAGSDFELDAEAGKTGIVGLAVDSREVRPGYLFAAMPGSQFDGAKFIPSAIENGAAAILMETNALFDAGSSASAETAGKIPLLKCDNPRQALARISARFYEKQPEVCIAVTGTNGKTSVASFVRQLWRTGGFQAASLGTIGLVKSSENVSSSHTTPEPISLHRILAELADDGIDHLAVEASSHGLQQHRLDGVRISAGAFTNISRDHLDYHSSFEDYFKQKQRLFSELLPEGAPAVIDMDAPGGEDVAAIARARGLNLVGVGKAGDTLRLIDVTHDGYKQLLTVLYGGEEYRVTLPLVGGFQVSNALVAVGLCLSLGACPEGVFRHVEMLEGARGRLEHAGETPEGSPVFIDYAHTPDALENALLALKPFVKGRLIVVFGCGGDRDKGKRPLMGKAAVDHADMVIVTDDNPRSEDPALIRKEVLAGAPEATEIGDRNAAIEAAVREAKAGDVVLVAGKGHETGQIIGDEVIPFSDHEAVEAAIKGV